MAMLAIKPSRPGITARVRSSSFTGHFAANNIQALAPKQSRRLGHLQCFRPTSNDRSINVSSSSTHSRISFHVRSCNESAVARHASSLHRPDCAWVRDSGDPRHTTRDKDCEQCQKEGQISEQPKKRDAAWQEHMNFWKDCLKQEPYEALFGRSNDMLRGRPWTPKILYSLDLKHQTLGNSIVGHVDKSILKGQSEGVTSATAYTHYVYSNPKAQQYSQKERGSNPIATATTADKKVEGHGSWSLRSINGTGKTIKESKGEFVFDPITMRMVPTGKPTQEQSVLPPAKETQAKKIPPKFTKDTEETEPSAIIVNAPPKSLPSLVDTSATRHHSSSSTKPQPILVQCTPQTDLHNAEVTNAIPLPAKQRLENSWRQEGLAITVDKAHDADKGAESGSSAHFAQSSLAKKSVLPTAYRSLTSRRRPYKEMTANELSSHRAALINSFVQRQSKKPKPLSAADLILRREINDLKQKMNAFESKRSHKSEQLGPLIKSADLKIDPKPLSVDASIVAGEGDMCPNVASYIDGGRWYKNKAPHASNLAIQHTLEDRALVRNVRDIYEEAYGSTNPSHRQSKLNSSLKEYEEKLDDPYLFRPKRCETERKAPSMLEEDMKKSPHAYESLGSPAQQGIDKQMIADHAALKGTGDLDKYLGVLENKLVDLTEKMQTLRLDIQRIKVADSKAPKDQLKPAEASCKTRQRASGQSIPLDERAASLQSALERYSPSKTAAAASHLEQSISSPVGNFASPTGFYNELVDEHKAINQEQKVRPQVSSTNPRIRKEEPVFSGAKANRAAWSEDETTFENRKGKFGRDRRRRRGIFKQTALSATIIGAFCYVTGLTIELLRSSNNPSGVTSSTGNVAGSVQNGGWFVAAEERSRGRHKEEASSPRSVPSNSETNVAIPVAPLAVAAGLIWAICKFLSN